jgi:hypothetical protein
MGAVDLNQCGRSARSSQTTASRPSALNASAILKKYLMPPVIVRVGAQWKTICGMGAYDAHSQQ